jgi:hypothetical protein
MHFSDNRNILLWENGIPFLLNSFTNSLFHSYVIAEWSGYVVGGSSWEKFKDAINRTPQAKIYKEKSFYAEEADVCNFFPGLEGKNCNYCRICEYRKKEGGEDECNGPEPWV